MKTKKCARCNSTFSCNAEHIDDCFCRTVTISPEQAGYMKEKYNDCLCKDCLFQIEEELNNADREIRLHSFKP